MAELQHAVVAGFADQVVKLVVEFDKTVLFVHSLPGHLDIIADPLQLLCSGPMGCRIGIGRLQRHHGLPELLETDLVQLHRNGHSAHEPGLVGCRDIQFLFAHAPMCQPALLETPDRFADRRSRDAKLRGEFRFGRERLSNFYLAADDLAFDQIRYLAIGGFDLNGVELNFCRLILGHLLIPLIICSIAVLRYCGIAVSHAKATRSATKLISPVDTKFGRAQCCNIRDSIGQCYPDHDQTVIPY